ncbi:M28 family peptidase [Polaribacter vadi]|uniref:M20/M25/M40 family metallo-hydrolase n=1 Tax=Polaribacter TaxID=52959 RepID=UPI001C0A5AFA|nr:MULTISPECIES: M20/M25/M40 family metallo-hydrolase [Polaribacter]MBU3011231.1 M28 family peptidase [Polaribacter vadi]MDO6741044.1 M28 family peptidase [Polaribacter sp. 1_MG-2023]
MKRLSSVLSVLILLAVIYWSFYDLKPSLDNEKISLVTKFSKNNALHHLKNISQNTHFVGTKEHKNVQNYIVNVLQKMGLETEIQTQTTINKKWMATTTTENIIAKIKGTENGKALLLLTHYDSSPHSSKGASDAGSGVVTILEGIRAFLANNKSHKNDIIILISDAEELGLLGAQAFIDNHKWAKDVGLVLNFEARGSGGPSYMLMETNGKNSKLLTEFLAAKPNFPVANSLMYSIYKKLPNDTDLTVFREDANINGFNFAFIDDHFDYHTTQDTYERLDRETLLHQADYLMQSLNYFSNSDLENLNSDEDLVYVNFPFIKMLTYPFAWVTPMLIIAVVIFILLLIYGFSSKKITIKGSLMGFIPFLISIVICGVISFYGWQLIETIHPHYKDILHGFTYNGYTYIFAFVFLNLTILLIVYKLFKKQKKTRDLLIAPIFIWLIINLFISNYLKGAGFFIIPVFIALFILAISLFMYFDDRSNRILFTILSIPTIYIFSPMIQMFPVGLGLKNLFISGILIALIFGLMSLVFYNKKAKWMLRFSIILTFIFFGLASYNSNFSVDNKKPNSIVYIQNSDDKTAYFGTYNNILDNFTKQIFDKTATKGSIKNAETKSKYNTRFKYHKKTDYRNILPSDISVDIDTIIGNNRFLELVISPKRKVNKLEFITKNKITLKQFKVNDALVLKGKNYTKKSGTFLIYHFANSDEDLTISFTIDVNQELDVILNEISYDLLTNSNFSINPRSEEMMPMPFVTNDAIIISKKLKL